MDAQSLALVCLHAMGAAHVEVSRSLASQQDLARYDYVLVEDRDSQRALPKWFDDVENVCNVLWLKQCLVSVPRSGMPPIAHLTQMSGHGRRYPSHHVAQVIQTQANHPVYVVVVAVERSNTIA